MGPDGRRMEEALESMPMGRGARWMKEETAKRRKTERSFSRLMQCSTEAERERARWEEGGEGAEEWRQR